MNRPYSISSRALEDLVAALSWYDRPDIGQGNRFLDSINNAIQLVRQYPAKTNSMPDGIERFPCKGFPYMLYYKVMSRRIVVIAVYPSKGYAPPVV
jgi:hypothetical protein